MYFLPTPKPQENLEPIDLKVLDLRQENNARKIGEGHRIVYGVAGSGKTVLLIAKARLLSAQNPMVIGLVNQLNLSNQRTLLFFIH